MQGVDKDDEDDEDDEDDDADAETRPPKWTAATPDPKEPDDTAAAAVLCVLDCLPDNTAGPVAGASIVCARCLPSRGNTVLGNSPPDTPDSPDAPHVSPARDQVVAVPVPEVKLPPPVMVPQEVVLVAAPAEQAGPAAPTVRRLDCADCGRPTTFPAPTLVAPSAPRNAHEVEAEVAALLRYICLAAFEVRDEEEDVGGGEADDDDDEDADADAGHDGAPRPEPRPVRSLEVMAAKSVEAGFPEIRFQKTHFQISLGCTCTRLAHARSAERHHGVATGVDVPLRPVPGDDLHA